MNWSEKWGEGWGGGASGDGRRRRGSWGGRTQIRRNAHGRRWKTLEDVAGRRGEASRNRLEDVFLILKEEKLLFLF